MTRSTFESKLRQAETEGTLLLPDAFSTEPGIEIVFSEALDGQQIFIAIERLEFSTTGATIYGQTAILSAHGNAIVTFILDDEELNLKLELDIDSDWNFSDNFDGFIDGRITNLNLNEFQFVAISYQELAPDHPVDLKPGLNLLAKLTLSEHLEPIRWLMGETSEIQLSGEVVLEHGLPKIILSNSQIIGSGIGIGHFNLSLEMMVIFEVDSDNYRIPIPEVFFRLASQISFNMEGETKLIPIQADFINYSGLLIFTSSFEAFPLNGLELLNTLFNNLSIGNPFPPGYEANALTLKNVTLVVNTDSRRMASISANIGLGSTWPVTENIHIENLHLTVTLLTAASALETMLIGDIVINDEVRFEIKTGLPDFFISAELDQNSVLPLNTAMEYFLPGDTRLPPWFPEIEFTDLQVGINYTDQIFSFRNSAQIVNDWPFPSFFTIDSFQSDLIFLKDSIGTQTYGSYKGMFEVAGAEVRLMGELGDNMIFSSFIPEVNLVDMIARFDPDNTALSASLQDRTISDIEIGYDGESADFTISANLNQTIPINEFINDIVQRIGITNGFPAVISDFKITLIKVIFNTEQEDFDFFLDGIITDPVNGVLSMNLKLTKNETNQYQKHFSGQITIGDRQFDLIFDNQNLESEILIALYQKPGGEQVSFTEFIGSMVPSESSIPALDFALKNALLVIDRETIDDDTTNKFLFTSDMDLGINLAGLGDLPIIGPKLSNNPLTLSLQPLLSLPEGNALTGKQLKSIRKLLPPGSPSIPEDLGAGGVGLITTLRWGDFEKLFELGVPPSEMGSDSDSHLPNTNPIPAPTGETPTPGEPQTEEVNQNFGAVHIASVSMSYEAGNVEIGLDGEVSIGPLSMALMGLGASFNVSTKELGFKLDGLALAYSKPPLEISGAFLHMGDQLVGEATVRAAAFGLSAIGAFSTLENGKPSLFIYAFLDFPLGGPSFFFVDGLALGFGYNRNLEIPPIEELRSFPLIAEVIGEAPSSDAPIPAGASASSSGSNDLLTQLEAKFQSLVKYITPMEGQYFLAVGIRFNSFKTIESFALLTVSFGHRLELAIMGFSKLTVPAKPPGAESFTPVAEIEMVFSVVFSPEEGSVKVQAYLTPSSYLLSGLCKLEGGFAFFTWFKGVHAGDFVVTLGGYHPKFQIPAHYPQPISVPRLAFTWKVSDLLSLKGTAYFALTPKAMMIGVGLEAKLKVGAEDEFIYVEADFKAAADFLIYWKPFHYEATASIEINATITLNLDLFSVSDDISAGADLQLWGPPFAGTADVHAKVLGYKANFTFDFGEDKKLPEPLSWDQFQTSFLPSEPDQLAPSLSVEKGLVKQINDLWVVNPKDLRLGISTIAPLTDETGSGLFVEPMVDKRTLEGGKITNSQLDIQIIFNEEDKTDEFRIVPFQKKFPSALWTSHPGRGSSPNINEQALKSMNGGYRVSPKKPPTVDSSHDFLVSVLSFEKEDKTSDSFDNSLTFSADKDDSFSKDNIDNAHGARLSLLNALGIDDITTINLGPKLADSFVISPQVIEIT